MLLAAVVAGGYYSASQEFQIGRGMRSLTTSFYAGEAGIREVLNDWDPDVYFALDPGDTLNLSPVTLEGGGSYTARIVRVGRAADSLKRYFYIEAIGRPRGPSLGERRQAMVVRSRYPRLCCQAAVTVGGEDMDFTGGNQEIVSGFNTSPTGGNGPWPDSVCAGISTIDTVGAVIDSDVFIDDTTRVIGSPFRYIVDSSLQENVFPDAIGDLSYPEIVAEADFTFNPTDTLTVAGADLDPRVVNGKCDRSHNLNWGEPTCGGRVDRVEQLQVLRHHTRPRRPDHAWSEQVLRDRMGDGRRYLHGSGTPGLHEPLRRRTRRSPVEPDPASTRMAQSLGRVVLALRLTHPRQETPGRSVLAPAAIRHGSPAPPR